MSDDEIDRLLYGSNKYVWFTCAQHTTCSSHIWRATVKEVYRSASEWKSNGCPRCNKPSLYVCPCSGTLQSKYPEVAALWDMENKLPGPNELHPNSRRRAKWICSKCDYRWEMKVFACVNLKRGCPRCGKEASESVGAEACRKSLTNLGETFQSEAIIADLRSSKNRNLKFDFLCSERSNPKRFRVAIEYDGIQHFKLTGLYYETLDDLKHRHINDSIKNLYCGQNAIHLLRIACSIPTNKIENVIKRFLARVEIASEKQTIIQYVGKEYDEHYFEQW